MASTSKLIDNASKKRNSHNLSDVSSLWLFNLINYLNLLFKQTVYLECVYILKLYLSTELTFFYVYLLAFK